MCSFDPRVVESLDVGPLGAEGMTGYCLHTAARREPCPSRVIKVLKANVRNRVPGGGAGTVHATVTVWPQVLAIDSTAL